MSKITYLQTAAFDKKDTELMRSELWWKVAEKCYLLDTTLFLLRFQSIAACKRFLKAYCSGKRICGINSFIVRKSPWPDVKYCALNVVDIYLTEKVEECVDGCLDDGNIEEDAENISLRKDICPLLKGERCLKVSDLKCRGDFYELCSIYLNGAYYDLTKCSEISRDNQAS